MHSGMARLMSLSLAGQIHFGLQNSLDDVIFQSLRKIYSDVSQPMKIRADALFVDSHMRICELPAEANMVSKEELDNLRSAKSRIALQQIRLANSFNPMILLFTDTKATFCLSNETIRMRFFIFERQQCLGPTVSNTMCCVI
jgi:hypothetical protein